MPKKNNLKPLSELIEKEYGKRGTPKREAFELGYQEFKLGVMIQEARKKKGLTQQELADKVGTNKAYISRVENNIEKDRRNRSRR